MEAIKMEITQKLQDICKLTSSDISAFAIVDDKTQTIHWKYVSGSSNDRYKNMVGRPGKGLSGSVVRFGRILIVDQSTPNYLQKRMEYPIMLAENLQTAVAIPIHTNGKIGGVLLVGSRSLHTYTKKQIGKIQEFEEELASYFMKKS